MTIKNMLQVEPLEIRSKSDNQLYEMNEASRHSGRKQPYQASHPHHKHHRRLRAQPEPPPEPDIEVEETFHTPELETPSTNPNDPFEKHFLAAAALQAQSQHSHEPKIRSSSFRNDKQRPSVIVREAEFNSPGNYSSSPNLLFPKDDININSHNNDARDLRRVRSFKSTSKGGVINRGDSFRKRNSSRNVASGSVSDSPRLASASSHPTDFICTPKTEEPQASYFRVQVLGAPGCGKTSITNQFMSSDYANVYDSMNVDEVERTITIQLDGEEATMEFIDVLPEEDSEDHEIDLTSDAYVVVYSVIDRTTFDAAVQSLYKLRHGIGIDRPIVLVGNKIDLVRKRKVKRNDVLSICRTYDCLHFETSAALNHNVDDILVTLLKQIRYKLDPERYTMPDYTLPEKEEEEKGSFFTKLYRRLSRKGRPKSKK